MTNANTLGSLRRHGILAVTVSVLGLCIVAGGCASGFNAFRRGKTQDAAAQPEKQVVGEATAEGPSRANPQAERVTLASNQVSVLPAPPSGNSVEIAPMPGQPAAEQPPEVLPLPASAQAKTPPNQPQTSTPPPTSGNSELITLRVDDLDVRKALELLSRQVKVNILVSPGVSGSVTISLQDKTLDESLQMISKACGLTVRRDGGVVYVTTLAELRQGEEEDLPIRVYRLNYVKSGDLESMIKPLLSSKGAMTASPESEIGIKTDVEKAGGNSMAGGEIIVVQDYEQVLRTIDRVVAQIDVQPIQVLIEAIIVRVTLEKGMDLGVNFALLDGAGRAVGVVGSGAAINAAAGFTPASVLTAGGKLVGDPLTGLAQDTQGVKFGFVDKSSTGFLEALQTVGETKVLACPRLLVLNKQRAELQLGKRLGYKTLTQTQTSTVEQVNFMDIGTRLLLRPFVSSDGIVRMEIHPERSTGKLDINGVPQTESAQVTTNVMVPNGATIVIGGLMEDEVVTDYAGIPLLSQLPWLGFLFRHTTDSSTKNELVVILTPRIWKPECPQALNQVGPPRALNLESRMGKMPADRGKDQPRLYDLIAPGPYCPPSCPPDTAIEAPPADTTLP